MAGTKEGVIKAWLSRKRASKKNTAKDALKEFGRDATEDTLQAGQSLFDVAKKWSTPLKDILEANGITSADQITPGMKLKIPAVKSDQQKALDSQTSKVQREARKAQREADREAKKKERDTRNKERQASNAAKREQKLRDKAAKAAEKERDKEKKVLEALGVKI